MKCDVKPQVYWNSKNCEYGKIGAHNLQKCKMRRRCVLRPRICTKTALQYCFPHENPTTFGTHLSSITTQLVNTFYLKTSLSTASQICLIWIFAPKMIKIALGRLQLIFGGKIQFFIFLWFSIIKKSSNWSEICTA